VWRAVTREASAAALDHWRGQPIVRIDSVYS
jgi:hypothetical protein